MSRTIQPGDRVELALGENRSMYIIYKVMSTSIDIYPDGDTTRISRLITTPQGWQVYQAEQIPFQFTFYPAPVRSISEAFTPSLDLSSLYVAPVLLAYFDFRSVKDWIDNPLIRINLFQESQLRFELFPFTTRFNLSIPITFDSPYREELQRYILDTVLPQYIAREPSASEEDTIESDLIKTLIRAATGMLGIKNSDVYYIFSRIFPNLSIQKTADDGDCYYSAIGLPLSKDSGTVRNDLANGFPFLPPENQNVSVETAVSTCPLGMGLRLQYSTQPQEFVQNFPNILRIRCGGGGVDCLNCLWGGNFLDELVSLVYTKPVVSVGIIDEDQDEHVIYTDDIYEEEENVEFLENILNEINPTFWNPDEKSLSFEVKNLVVTVSIIPIVPEAEESGLLNSTDFIAYIATQEKHVDSILPKI